MFFVRVNVVALAFLVALELVNSLSMSSAAASSPVLLFLYPTALLRLYDCGMCGDVQDAAKGTKKKRRVLVEKDAESVDAARQYAPDVQGACLHMETTWHCRWRGVYPVIFPPFSNSVSFGPSCSESRRLALVQVLS